MKKEYLEENIKIVQDTIITLETEKRKKTNYLKTLNLLLIIIAMSRLVEISVWLVIKHANILSVIVANTFMITSIGVFGLIENIKYKKQIKSINRSLKIFQEEKIKSIDNTLIREKIEKNNEIVTKNPERDLVTTYSKDYHTSKTRKLRKK